jgi:CheY-like chemotaxis protein
VASRIEVRVSDSGVGIAPEFLPRVFERFMQADGSASRRFGGLGLGLAIVRHLVELHGGDVSAESAGEGHGATFSFRLPVRALADAPSAAEPGGRPAGAAATPAYDLSGVRVLVVDDEADARELVRVVLAAAGAEVSVTASAQEALGLLGDGLKVDVIISDIGMPEMDGYHLIQAMRALGGGTEMTPAIALTAYGRAEDAARALASGYQRHLTKPVTAAMLVSAVHHAVATDISRA